MRGDSIPKAGVRLMVNYETCKWVKTCTIDEGEMDRWIVDRWMDGKAVGGP